MMFVVFDAPVNALPLARVFKLQFLQREA